MRNSRAQNIVGGRVRSLRMDRGWTQEGLARRCQLSGFDISRSGVSQIEGSFRKVSDLEMVLLARVFRVSLASLVPDELPTWHGRPSAGD